MGNYKFYAVKNGHIPGIYSNWSEAEKQIKGFPNQKYKGFDDETDAINYLYGLENRYFGLKRIGSGGFAEVFRFQENNNDVAIKILKKEYSEDQGIVSRFKREYEITNALSDIDNIINVFDFSEQELSYKMEYLEFTLLKFINQYELEDDEKLFIIQQILEVMQKVHDRKILHRDLSPSNIFINNGKIKIADFGLGKNLSSHDSHVTQYTHGFGQYYYCSPEQATQLKDATNCSDIFSIGKIINFIMTKNPNNGNHILKSVVEVATATDPGNRYSDCKTMLNNVVVISNYITSETEQANIDLNLRSGKLDVLVENYLNTVDGLELCEKLGNIEYPSFDKLLLNYMSTSDSRAIEIIDKISHNFQEYCGWSFAANDTFAYFSYLIIKNDFSQIIKNKAVSILNYVAWGVNRFYAQDLVNRLMETTSNVNDILIHSRLKDRTWDSF